MWMNKCVRWVCWYYDWKANPIDSFQCEIKEMTTMDYYRVDTWFLLQKRIDLGPKESHTGTSWEEQEKQNKFADPMKRKK